MVSGGQHTPVLQGSGVPQPSNSSNFDGSGLPRSGDGRVPTLPPHQPVGDVEWRPWDHSSLTARGMGADVAGHNAATLQTFGGGGWKIGNNKTALRCHATGKERAEH